MTSAIKRKTVKLFFLISILFSLFLLNGTTRKEGNCEPSLIFPEIFFIESYRHFSYSIANDLYGDAETLKIYIDNFLSADEALHYRYLYYLRTSANLQALTTLILMVNGDSFSNLLGNPATEFLNIVYKGAKPFRGQGEEGVKTDEIEKYLDSEIYDAFALNFNFFIRISLYAKEGDISDLRKILFSEKGLAIIYNSLILLTNNTKVPICPNDAFFKNALYFFRKLFSEELFYAYMKLFYYNIGERDFSPSALYYLKLKKSGAISELVGKKSKKDKKYVYNVKSFVLNNLKIPPKFTVVQKLPDLSNKSLAQTCLYLKNRLNWLEKGAVDRYNREGTFYRNKLFYNKVLQIVEQCPGSDFLPFKLKENEIFILKNNLWCEEIAYAYYYVMVKKLSEGESQFLIDSAISNSLSKSEGSPDSHIDLSFLGLSKINLRDAFIYTNGIDKLKIILKSVLGKQMNWGWDKNSPEKFTSILMDAFFHKETVDFESLFY